MTPDVNVLVAAARADHPHHAPALTWLSGARDAAPGALTVLPVVAVGFLRVVTQRRIFPVPTPTPLALDFLRVVLDGREPVPAATEWPVFVRLCTEQGLAAGDVTDAWIAAAVADRREHLVTFDRGFRRLLPARSLTVLTPVRASR